MINVTLVATNSVPSYSYCFPSVVRTFEVYSLSNIQEYDTVLLTIITMLYHDPQNLFVLYLEICTL